MKRQDSTPDLATLEGGNRSSINAVVSCSIIMTVFATVLVYLRVYVRRTRGRIAMDDWLIIACLPFMYAMTTTALLAVYRGGLGHPLQQLAALDSNILSVSLKCLFGMEIIYSSLISLIKLSVLAMYRKIFPTPLVNKGTYVLGVTVLAWWVAVILVTLLQCHPLYGLWDLAAMETAQCMDQLELFLGNAIPNIIIDAFILALPLYEVARLQMTRLKKIGVFIIFLLGGVTIVISGVRLRSGLHLLGPDETDYTLLVGPLWAWTVVEPAMGIICACLPTVGGPLVGTIVKLVTTPKPPQRNESSGLKGCFKNIPTNGSGSSRAIKRPGLSKVKGDDGTGSFERLNDESAVPSPTDLWPKGYRGERIYTVSGRRTPSEQSDDIPLTSITVKQEMSWSESKAAT
ncbi:hypothetical protein SUNI508_05660 [Seiridium unicorne]|uniref:Rhodopsin domain-containing protein n=1 Tax=Seiridium unicorne TaxID=138068 RepID=A0ABR2V4M9_9PEZI